MSNKTPAQSELEDVIPPKAAKVTNGSMLDVEAAMQATIESIDETQSELDALNEKASEEILAVENKFNKQREPFYAKRSELIQKIKGFWLRVFMSHSQICSLLSEKDEDCLQHLMNIHVTEKDDVKTGYKIKFMFNANENPYFKNEILEKEIGVNPDTGAPSTKATKIDWKDGKNLDNMAGSLTEETGGKNGVNTEQPGESFFMWFNDEDGEAGLDNDGGLGDELGEIIKDDIWPNPLQYYLVTDDDEDDDDDDDVDEQGNFDEEEEN